MSQLFYCLHPVRLAVEGGAEEGTVIYFQRELALYREVSWIRFQEHPYLSHHSFPILQPQIASLLGMESKFPKGPLSVGDIEDSRDEALYPIVAIHPARGGGAVEVLDHNGESFEEANGEA